MKTYILGLFFLTTTPIACNSTVENSATIEESSVENQDTLSKTSEPQAEPTDYSKISILIPGSFREDFKPDLKNLSWFELYQDAKDQTWKLEKAAMQWTKAEDLCSGSMTTEVSSSQENTLLFIAGLPQANHHPITVLSEKQLLPGRELTFVLSGKTFHLKPTAEKIYDFEENEIKNGKFPTDAEGNPDHNGIKNFELAYITDSGKTFRLIKIDEIESGVWPEILWAGDLNGDNLPDLILNLSQNYEEQHIYLFLSDPATPEAPPRKVAETHRVFDC